MPDLTDLLLCRWSEDGAGPVFYNCWNLNREVFRRFGKFLPLYSEYIESLSQRDAFIRKIIEHDFKLLEKPEPGCLVGLLVEPPCLTHGGVILEDVRRFIQIREKIGVTIDRLDDKRWASRIEGFYRYVGSQKNKHNN